MKFADFWLKFAGKILRGAAGLSVVFIILVLGDLTGTFENGLLLWFIETVSPDFPVNDLTSYHYQALILAVWGLLFLIINLKYFSGAEGIQSIRFNKLSWLAVIMFILFYFISPRPYVINIEWLTQFETLFYKEDGIFEVLTAVFLFLAALAFFASAIISIQNKLDWKIPFLQSSLGLFCLFFCMEEISWGQRIIDYGSVEWAAKVNSQNETNVHNICNKVFHTKYCLQFMQIIFNICFSLALLFFAGWGRHIQRPSFEGLLNLQKYYFLAIAMALGTLLPNELNEELLALFFLVYSFDVLKFYRNYQPH